MATLADVRRVTATKPMRSVIYGPPGVGKSSLASEFTGVIFLQTEDGESTGTEFDTFGLMQDWDSCIEALGSLASEQHDYRHICVDSLDKLEPLMWAHYCERNKLNSVEDAGYGRGYVELDGYWNRFFRGLNYLRNELGMGVILIGHSHVVNAPNPTGVEYPRWDIALHKRANAIVTRSVDAILMLDYDNGTYEQKGKGGAKATKSTGSTLRYIYCQGSPARNAKNRFGMPERVRYDRGQGYEALAKYLPGGTQYIDAPAQSDEAYNASLTEFAEAERPDAPTH